MSETKKKKAETPAAVDKSHWTISQLLLDCTKDKYRLVTLATRWAHEIKIRDQSGAPVQTLVDSALREILTGQVSMDEIEKLPPPARVEKKLVDIALKTVEEAIEGEEKKGGSGVK